MRNQINWKILLSVAVLMLVAATDVHARDTVREYSIADLLDKTEYAARLEGISFYFGEQSHPKVKRSFGEYRTNKKTNAFNKSDLQACEWVMLSALLQLHSRATSLGANAVVNIKSNYRDNEFSSETHYICGAGGIMAGAALIGTFVELE